MDAQTEYRVCRCDGCGPDGRLYAAYVGDLANRHVITARNVGNGSGQFTDRDFFVSVAFTPEEWFGMAKWGPSA